MSTGLSAITIPEKPSIIPASNADILKGLSPLNWAVRGNSVHAAGGGASITVAFTGTNRVHLLVDPAATRVPVAARYPVLAWTVNGGPLQTHQLTLGESSVPLASDIPNPVIDLYLKGFSPYENRFVGETPDNSVKITGFEVDSTGRTVPTTFPTKVWLNIGDSIFSGDAALSAQGQGRVPPDAWAMSDDARASYCYLLAQHFGYRESRLAYGGYAWKGNGKMPPLTTLIDQITSVDSRISNGHFSPAPDVVLINLGENGVPKTAEVTNALKKLCLRTGRLAKIIVMIPASGKGRTEITNAFGEYKKSSRDTEAYLVDLGKITYDTVDGCHPTAAGHRAIYEAALPALTKILGK